MWSLTCSPTTGALASIGLATPCGARSVRAANHRRQAHQVERIKEHASIGAPVAQPVEHRQAIVVASYGLAIDQARCSLEREHGARDQWEASGPGVPVAGEKPHARRVAAHEHSEAVVF